MDAQNSFVFEPQIMEESSSLVEKEWTEKDLVKKPSLLPNKTLVYCPMTLCNV